MIRINVASEIKYESNSAQLIPVLVVLMIACTIAYYIPVYYADLKTAQAEEIQTRITEKNEQLMKLKVDFDKVKALAVHLAELTNRADRIRSLSRGRKQPVLLLDTLQAQHLERMWFTFVGVKENEIQLNGFALDHSIIAEYAGRLKLTIGEQSNGPMGDLKDFVPPFMKDARPKTEMALAESVTPVIISNVQLNKSLADTKENVLVQSFDIKFTANLK
jgi:Tfp pilus assembly protein PilN